MIKYINIKTNCGIETVDEFNSDDHIDERPFFKYVRDMCKEYNMTMLGHYISQRCTNDWKNK